MGFTELIFRALSAGANMQKVFLPQSRGKPPKSKQKNAFEKSKNREPQRLTAPGTPQLPLSRVAEDLQVSEGPRRRSAHHSSPQWPLADAWTCYNSQNASQKVEEVMDAVKIVSSRNP
eukprot:Selendium_serpulae@DN238_c0_g1_i1.p1